MEQNNIDYIKESLTSERSFISPLLIMLTATAAGECALLQKEKFDDITVGLLGVGAIVLISILIFLVSKLEKIDKLHNLLKKNKS